MKEMTHKAAVRRMANYLKNSVGCTVVVAELSTQNTETPDVIGFKYAGHSTMIEVKVSRSDFLADKTKRFRRQMDLGMGDLRYFAAPEGIIKVEELPEAWGLLEIGEHRVKLRKDAEHQPSNKKAEVVVLMSALRRVEIATAVFVRTESEVSE